MNEARCFAADDEVIRANRKCEFHTRFFRFGDRNLRIHFGDDDAAFVSLVRDNVIRPQTAESAAPGVPSGRIAENISRRLCQAAWKRIMTRDPVSQPPDSTIAFVLNLMSQGGFRHLPILDDGGHPVGIISVKDVVDHLVETFVEDLMEFEVDR